MEELLDDSQMLHNDIRSVQSNIAAQLENFQISDGTTFVKTSYVCDTVRNHILNYHDEPHLSKTQNNYRRIYIASELFTNLCSAYAHVVDYEYTKIINDMLQWEKYKQISRKISSKMQSELKREKYFIKEAQEILVKSIEDTAEETDEVPATDRDERKSGGEILTRYGGESLPTNLEEVEVAEEGIPSHEMNRPLEAALDTSFADDMPPQLTENLSVIREGVTADSFHLERTAFNPPEPEHSLFKIEEEIFVAEPIVQQKSIEDIDAIRQILEDQTFEEEKGEIEQPENLLHPEDKTQEIRTEAVAVNSPTGEGEVGVASEDPEKWSLPSLEETERERKKRRLLIIDKAVTIPDYAAKAIQLNKNINIERVQVFLGSPKILQAFSVSHMMTFPGRKSSLFRGVRSSKLSTLYNRHLKVEERPVELPFKQRRIEEQSAVDISKARINTETTEDVGVRTGMHSVFEKSDVLVDIPERSRLEIDTSVAAPAQESLIGIPMSRILNSAIEPPEKDEMERINSAPILSTPRVLQLQGKSLEPRTSPVWFYSTTQNPPKSMYKKFSYVYDKLEKYWTMLESQQMEKCITLNEFFHFERDGNLADFLTVLRIVDKLSIKRKLLLEYKDGDVLIRPFESPYMSDTQLLLRGKEPIL